MENGCGLIALVQKAGRASERVKKRVAIKQARENEAGEDGAGEGEGESGDQVEGRAPK